jgi:hypothetical protein
MNTLISFEIARLLKGNGFEHETTSYYGGSGELLPHSYTNNTMQRFRYSAPTIVETIMWLYEKHGIWISVDMVFEEDQTGFWYCIRQSKADDMAIMSDEFNSSTEAYEVAIKHTLENLIQGGNK